MNLEIPKSLLRYIRPLATEARRLGQPIYAVGGCVRDWILGAETKDLDILLESDPTPLVQYCVRRWDGKAESFGQFGTVRFHAASSGFRRSGGGFRIDFVRARAESYPSPAALPVVRPGTLSEDLARRDFTVNAMAAELSPAGEVKLIDLHGGLGDIRKSLIRVLHDASFRDDPTRIFRAARYACRYRMKIESKTEALVREAVASGYVGFLSRERLRNELLRILTEKEPVGALKKVKLWKLDRLYHPRFVWPKQIIAGKTEWERLGMIAVEMERRSRKAKSPRRDGAEFVRSLNLERPVSQSILEALEIEYCRASPRAPLEPLARRVLELSYKKFPLAALKPLLLTGSDLQTLGLRPDPKFRQVLELAAQAQWAGLFTTRAQALQWLRDHIFRS